MKPKKYKQKDLEGKKFVFFQIGLAVAIFALILAFEWKSGALPEHIFIPTTTEFVEPIIPVTIDKAPEPPLVEKMQVAVLTDIFDIDNTDLPTINVMVDPGMLDTAKYKPMVFKRVEQQEEDENGIIPIYAVQQKPTFKGKDANTFVTWVYSQLVYPDVALKNGIEGKVYISFVINKDGKLDNIQVNRAPDIVLANEVVRIIKTSPPWEPGMQGIRKVAVSYQLSIQFKLQ